MKNVSVTVAWATAAGFVSLLAASYGAAALRLMPAEDRSLEWWVKVLGVFGVAGICGLVCLAGIVPLLWQLVQSHLHPAAPANKPAVDNSVKPVSPVLPDSFPAKVDVRLTPHGVVALRDVEILAELAERYKDDSAIVLAVIGLQNMVFTHRFNVEGKVDVVPDKPAVAAEK